MQRGQRKPKKSVTPKGSKRKSKDALPEIIIPEKKTLTDSELKRLLRSSDVTSELPNPHPANRISEVDMARAPTGTKKDHDYRPVLFAGVTDIDSINEPHVDVDDLYSQLKLPVNQKSFHVIVPEKASWFNIEEIHEIEKRALPEFFNESNPAKTPDMYKYYRDYMINRYRSDPYHYLTNTTCRKRLVGDLCSVFKVHSFLQMWGLINLNLDFENRPGHITEVGLLPNGHFMVLSETESGVIPSEPVRLAHKPVDRQVFDVSELTDWYNRDDDETKIDCSSVGMEAKRTESEKQSSSYNYTREWTNYELQKLVEGVGKYRDNWNQISEYVGTRTLDECLLCFIRLPLEDPFTVEDYSGAAEDLLPFSKSANPLMSTIAFLANVIDPRVASSASKEALEFLSQYMMGVDNSPMSTEKIVEQNVLKIKEALEAEKLSRQMKSNLLTSSSSSRMETTKDFHDPAVIKKASDIALAAGAKKAEQLTQREEYRLKALTALLLDKMMKKLDLKLSYIENLEKEIERQILQNNQERQLTQRDREDFHKDILEQHGLEAWSTADLPSRADIVIVTAGPANIGDSNLKREPPAKSSVTSPPKTNEKTEKEEAAFVKQEMDISEQEVGVLEKQEIGVSKKKEVGVSKKQELGVSQKQEVCVIEKQEMGVSQNVLKSEEPKDLDARIEIMKGEVKEQVEETHEVKDSIEKADDNSNAGISDTLSELLNSTPSPQIEYSVDEQKTPTPESPIPSIEIPTTEMPTTVKEESEGVVDDGQEIQAEDERGNLAAALLEQEVMNSERGNYPMPNQPLSGVSEVVERYTGTDLNMDAEINNSSTSPADMESEEAQAVANLDFF